MADVRINGKRLPRLTSVDSLKNLLPKIELICQKNRYAITGCYLNEKEMDIDNEKILMLKLETEDKVEIKIESPEQLSYESLSVAQDMADLLMFDIKVSTIRLWNSEADYEPTLATLLKDCYYFLSLAARPIYLLNKELKDLDPQSEACLKELDKIANALEDATLFSVHKKNKEACEVLILIVKPAIETWIGLSAMFAEKMNISAPNPSLELDL